MDARTLAFLMTKALDDRKKTLAEEEAGRVELRSLLAVPRSRRTAEQESRLDAVSALSLLSCMADFVGVLQFRELGCAMFVLIHGAGQRKVAVSGVGMPEIHVFLLVRPVLRSALVEKKPILVGLLEPKLPL